MANSNNITSSHRFPHDLEFCGHWSTNIPRSKIAWLKKKDFTHNLLGAKYFTQSLGDSCLLANRTMTVLRRHTEVWHDYWCLVLTRCAIQIHKTWNQKSWSVWMAVISGPPPAFALVISCWNNGFWNNTTGMRTQAQTLLRVTEQFIWWL